MEKRAKQIEEAAQIGWDKGAKVAVIHMVEIAGKQIDNVYYPFGTGVDSPDGKMKFTTINISTNACKSFGYNFDDKSFEYDVGFNGRPFYGKIPVWSILAVYDMNTQEQFWTADKIGKEPKSEKVDLSLVTYNPNIPHMKSTAILSLV